MITHFLSGAQRFLLENESISCAVAGIEFITLFRRISAIELKVNDGRAIFDVDGLLELSANRGCQASIL